MKKKMNNLMALILASAAVLGSGAILSSCGDQGGNTPHDSSEVLGYKITVVGEGFTVSGLPEEGTAAEGTRIRFTVTPTEEGKVVGTVKVNDEVLTAGGGGRYSFNMPAENVTITITVAGVSNITIDTSEVKIGSAVSELAKDYPFTAVYHTIENQRVEQTVDVTHVFLDLLDEKDDVLSKGGVSLSSENR
jgi:hypothetical protein